MIFDKTKSSIYLLNKYLFITLPIQLVNLFINLSFTNYVLRK